MTGNVGLWIDHRYAVIVGLKEDGEHTRHVLSHMESDVRFSRTNDDTRPEDQRDRRLKGHLDKYYDKVVACIRNADAILILGPGEARGELKAHLESESLGGHIAGCDPADKMTVGQLITRIRRYFAASIRTSGRMAGHEANHAAVTYKGK